MKGKLYDRLRQRVVSEHSSSTWQVFYIILDHFEKLTLLFVLIFGVVKGDFYHLSLLYVFVFFIIYPEWFRRNIYLLIIYISFFALIQYTWSINGYLVSNNEYVVKFAQIFGFSVNAKDARTQVLYFHSLQQWFMIILLYVQKQIYRFQGIDHLARLQRCHELLASHLKGTYEAGTLALSIVKELMMGFMFVILSVSLWFSRNNLLFFGFFLLMLHYLYRYMAIGLKEDIHSGV